MANRDRNRPGLVYGPVRPSGPRDRGRIVGNLLGFLIVVVTIAVLGIAIYFFGQSSGVEPAPPTAIATAVLTPPPEGSPVTQPSPTPVAGPSASPTLSASAEPTTATITPAPTLFIPPVVTGPGFITFGTNVDTQLQVTDPKTKFAIDEPMVWSAYLTEAANSADLKIRILKLDANQPSGERLVREDLVQPDVQGVQIFFRRLRPIGASDGAGLFTIEYVRGEDILSTGSFLVQ